jgi:heme/copper-type cytochrome/quinol oxidase subunit 4
LSAKFAKFQTEATSHEAAESLERIGRFVPTIIGFALGGLLAAIFVLVSESWWSLAMPLVIILILAIAAFTDDYQKKSQA